MSSQQVARSTGVPNDFYRFVHFIETRQSTPVRVSFTTNEELKVCAKYFIERAIKHPHLMKQFAEGVKRIFFVTPFYVDKDSNFKREILHETQNQINELLRAPSGWTVERAESVVKFFGEIYNIGFIFPWILKKFLDVFKSNSGRSLTATCYKVLLETVKSEVPKLTLNDDTEVGKMLRQMVQEFEKTRLENSKNENLKIEAAKLSQLKIILPPTTLHSIIAKLNAENSKEILKKIADFKTDDTWQSCYELLIERALSAPELAESILLICKKIPDNRNESWSKIKVDDYKKLITRMIVDKFNELFDNASSGSAATQVFRIVNLIQKLREASMCSIGCVASLLDVMIDCAEKDMNLAATILVKLVRIFRNGISAEKIKKIPLEKREKILTILLDCESSASSKADLKRIAEYLSVDFTDNSSEVSIDESLIEDFGRNGTGIMLNGADGSSTLQAKMSSKSSTTSSASGWNGFSQKFPSFTEAVDIQQQLRQAHQDSFESLIDKMTAENSDQILSKIDDSLAIPEGEAPYETLLDKLRFSPELLEPIVDVIKKILSCQPGTSKTSEFDKKSTFMCQIIHHKLEISLNSFDNKSSDNQVLTVIKLVQRLYENSLITKHFINNVIESVRIYENDNNLKISGSAVFKKIATNLEKFRDKQMSSNDRNNSEMTSSGDWSDFDSGILTSCMKR